MLPSLFYAPWAITEEGFRLIAAIASRGELFAEVQRAAQERWQSNVPEALANVNPQSVALIPVRGPLFRHAGLMTDISGATSYEGIRKSLYTALADSSIEAILFDIDSPGGEVHGCSELSKTIYEARGQKPIIAYASGLCASAAYWIASACDEVFASATAQVGSIGVRTMLMDDSKRDEMQGIKEYEIVSSQSPYKVVDPASAGDRARVTDAVTKMAQVFIDDVARNRGVTSELVESKYGKGDVLLGQDAVKAGLIEGISSLEETLQTLTKGESWMAPKELASKASMKSMKCDGCAKAMDDEDEDDIYCAACYKTSAKASFGAQVMTLLGCQSTDVAMGALLALKAGASEVEELKCKLASLEQDKAATETQSLIAQAISDGRIPASKKEEMETFAKTYNLTTLKSFMAMLPKAALPVMPPSSNEPAIKTAASGHSFTASQLAILKATKVSPEEWLAHEAQYRNYVNPKEEK